MQFDIEQSINILERTPQIITTQLNGLPIEWIHSNEGGDTWSPYDIVGHLIHGERTDWITRMEIILSNSSNKEFQPFDRFAQFENSKGKTIEQLLREFSNYRAQNIEKLKAANISEDQYQLEGIHPAFGTVTLSQLLSTWVVHDLGHIAQINRVMAKQYKEAIGPWQAYLPIVN